jgi:hypothetical protein
MSVVSEQTTGDNWKLGLNQFAPFASGDPQCHPIMTDNQIDIKVKEMRRQSNRFGNQMSAPLMKQVQSVSLTLLTPANRHLAKSEVILRMKEFPFRKKILFSFSLRNATGGHHYAIVVGNWEKNIK